MLGALRRAGSMVAASVVWLGLFALSSCFVVTVMVLALLAPRRSVQV